MKNHHANLCVLFCFFLSTSLSIYLLIYCDGVFKRIISLLPHPKKNHLAENISEFECNENEFACYDENNKCVHRSAVCDGTSDCPNGRDEEQSKCTCTFNQVSLRLWLLKIQIIWSLKCWKWTKYSEAPSFLFEQPFYFVRSNLISKYTFNRNDQILSRKYSHI